MRLKVNLNDKCINSIFCRSYTNATPHHLTFLAESPLVLCGIIPTWWLQDNMAEILLERPDGSYGWSSELGKSLTVPELRALLILKFEVNRIISCCMPVI